MSDKQRRQTVLIAHMFQRGRESIGWPGLKLKIGEPGSRANDIAAGRQFLGRQKIGDRRDVGRLERNGRQNPSDSVSEQCVGEPKIAAPIRLVGRHWNLFGKNVCGVQAQLNPQPGGKKFVVRGCAESNAARRWSDIGAGPLCKGIQRCRNPCNTWSKQRREIEVRAADDDDHPGLRPGGAQTLQHRRKPQWSWYYPFISPAVLPPKPEGFSGHDHVFGLIPNLPFVLFAFAAPLAVWRRMDSRRSVLAVWLVTAGVLAVIMPSILCSFFGSLASYMMDFTPTLMLLAGVGLLVVTDAARGWRPWKRRALHAIWTVLLVYSVAFGALYSLQLDLLLYERNPPLHHKLAAVFNRVAYAAERLTGRAYGPIELTIRLSPQPFANRETLVAMGHSPEDAYLFIQTTGDGRVQFGVEGTGGAPQLSWPIALDRKQPHRVTLSTGALYPRAHHPYFPR